MIYLNKLNCLNYSINPTIPPCTTQIKKESKDLLLYHATSENRGKIIFSDRKIKCNIDRYYTLECNGSAYSTNGYIYLSNEIFFSLYFANCHNLCDKTNLIYIFKINLNKNLLLPDEDEKRMQDKYNSNSLDYSLLELKSCRVAFDIIFSNHNMYYTIINSNTIDINKLIKNIAYYYNYTIQHYSNEQKDFIKNIQWLKLN